MLYILLDSIHSYGLKEEDNCIEILIYTSTKFMNMIKQSPFYKDFIYFEINDTYGSVEKACKARLDLFSLQSLRKYIKILYLDTDIIVKGDLQNIFDLCLKDQLYVLEEGSIASDSDFWGKTLFVNAGDLELYTNNNAFSSGIMLFNNCEKIKELFSCIKEDIIKRPFTFYCHDQPYIVYTMHLNMIYMIIKF